MNPARLLVAAAILCVGVWPSRAAACGPCLCQERGVSIFPTYSEIPTNVVFIVLGVKASVAAVTLRQNGGDIPFFAGEELDADSFLVMPDSPLTPGSTVVLTAGGVNATYTVGPFADTTHPPVPELFAQDAPTGYCEGGVAATVGNARAGTEPVLLVFEIETTEGVQRRALHQHAFDTGRITLGNLAGDCLGRGQLDTADETVTVRARAYDGAANGSALSPPVELSLQPVVGSSCPDQGPFACATAGGAPLALLVGLIGMTLRRRRR